MLRTTARPLAALLLGCSVLALAHASGKSEGPAAVDTRRIIKANKEPGNWMSHGRTYDEQRYSPLKQINEKNVGQLGLAWYYDHNTYRGVEGTPLVVDGVMYANSAWNITFALDAKTGKELWRYDPKVPREWNRYVCCDVISRGLAVYEGKVILATLDGRLIALDARNGKPLWETLTVDNKNWPYSITGAPRAFNGKVVIGNGGAELGVRGYVTAYDVNTGKQLWRFWTVPGNPANGFENKTMEWAAKTWDGEWWKQGGGGTAWDSIVYDPEFNRVYIGTGNGSPWPHKLRSNRKGDNLFLASIVAVDADTGEYVWHYQEVPEENWDFTATQPMMLADLKIDGRKRKVIMQAPKNGFFYVIDRTNGKLISAGKFVPNNWASHIDLETGRPVLLPDANYDDEPRLLSPNNVGAHNWYPMSYNPNTGLVYFPVLRNYSIYEIEENYVPRKFTMSWGTAAPPSEKNAAVRAELAHKTPDGWLTAWDPVKQKEVWRVPYGRGNNGGTLTTAGNLVIEGTSAQTLAIYRATDGKKLWESPVQTVPMAGPITYTVDGEQYIAINAGGAANFRALRERPTGRATARTLAFKLGGSVKLPPIPEPPPLSPPPRPTGSVDQIKEGEFHYTRVCAQCHGRDAIAINAIPDLRHMSPATRAEFTDIVLKGTRAAKGMVSFADQITPEQAEAIYQYLTARAWDDWNR
ncbi:MAG: PQQ-dependent dehydrogenase, methanol/ethanol family [Steroidobacteraceae bacterium]|nr:PQQ-dependent dehydrogenase, methanol/ethanol family [Steroidobacteraceae bacterium]